MTAYTYRMPAGIAGAISRPQDLTVEPTILSNDAPFSATVANQFGINETVTAYGVPGKYDDNGYFVPLASGDEASVVVGFLVRPYPTTSVQDLNRQARTGAQIEGDLLKRGYLNVNIGGDASAIKRGAPVYFDIANQQVLAESAKDSNGNDTSLEIPSAVFNGPGDAAGNVEIAYNI
ncbi:hypothetical protein R84981_002829 [Carnimonas sp. R-84981]|uniref:structural cement protein Gp24 n=1 Tax=Carnimonas bestiolae TaxID=3402172 RepID=UPI003EDC4D2E